MLFRRTYQYNVDKPDTYLERKKDVDRLDEEVFEIDSITFYLNDGKYFIEDLGIFGEIIESQNYFTIKRKDGFGRDKKYELIKWSSVLRLEFTRTEGK